MSMIETLFSGISVAVFTWLIVIERRISRLESKFDMLLKMLDKCVIRMTEYDKH